MEGTEASTQLDQPGSTICRLIQDCVGLLALAGILGAVAVHTLFLRKLRSRLPPGPYPWPILGSLLLLGERPHQALACLAAKYGPLMYLRLGSTPAVVISSPNMAREFLSTHDQEFSYRPNLLSADILVAKDKDIAFANGAYWRLLRKICLLELFTPKRLESFRTVRTDEITATMKTIIEESHEGKVVDLNFKLWSTVANNMTRMLFKKRYFGTSETLEDQKEARRFKTSMEEVLHWMGVFIIGDFNPSLQWVSKLQGIDARMRKVNVEVSSLLQQFIDDHRHAATIERGGTTSLAPTDFIDVLLSTVPSDDGCDHLSDESIRLVIIDLINGGTDTSALTTEWAMAELLRHPDVMKRAQTELDAVVGTTRLVQESDLPHLKYLQAVVKETFRLHPVVPLLLPHECREACQVLGYNLPAKTRVLVNVWAIGRDPSIWERPLAFEPDRFILQHPDIDVKGHNFQLLPFGSGRRGCPGLSLGLLMVQILLAHLLQSFNWSLPKEQDPDTLDMSEHFGLTVGREHSLHVVAHPRLAAHLYE